MIAGASDVGDENIAGGFARIERYARLAICKRLPLALVITVDQKKEWLRGKGGRTNYSVSENNEKASVIYPLYFKAPICILPFRKSELNVARLELLGKAS
jgi:hypothetical protein